MSHPACGNSNATERHQLCLSFPDAQYDFEESEVMLACSDEVEWVLPLVQSPANNGIARLTGGCKSPRLDTGLVGDGNIPKLLRISVLFPSHFPATKNVFF